jgi:hypothetical protein
MDKFTHKTILWNIDLIENKCFVLLNPYLTLSGRVSLNGESHLCSGQVSARSMISSLHRHTSKANANTLLFNRLEAIPHIQVNNFSILWRLCSVFRKGGILIAKTSNDRE